MDIYVKIIEELKNSNSYVATMESCTGGSVASEITNHSGASQVLKFSAVTYSNEYKIKMGVDEQVIDQYSVYSMETAIEMAKNISFFANADYGIGITGKLNDPDPANERGLDDEIFVSIYDKEEDLNHNYSLKALNVPRRDNKEIIIEFIGEHFLEILEMKKDYTDHKKKVLN